MKCRTCARRLDLEKLDYTVGCKHEQMEGFICLACAFEGVAYWMTNISEDDYCEEYVEKQVTGKLINVEIPTKCEPEEAEKQVNDELISRRAVLDLWEGYMPFIATKACEYDTKLRKLPSEPVGNPDTLEWIPCSERLPEKEGWYITTVESEKTGRRRIENDLFAVDIALAHGHTPNKFCKDGYRQRTVAWMPFPEPYREVE